MLRLEVVPRTEIVWLASPTFSYSYFDKRKKPLPQKAGSFQVFVRNYKDATIYIREFQADPLSEDLKRQFRQQFERLVILDYLIRNTGPPHTPLTLPLILISIVLFVFHW